MSFTDDEGVRHLAGADLDLAPGSKTCVVGTTGEDQTALLAVILGLQQPERGTVLIDGHDVGSLPLDVTRSTVAVVLPDPWMVTGSIADNISFGHPGVTRSHIEAAARQTGLDGFVAGLDGGYDAPAVGLTAGDERRISLARALVRNPGILVIEELTADLDADDERRVMRAIDGAASGRTTIIMTHRLSLARRADSVLVIDDGRIAPYRGRTDGVDHAHLWDTRVPPVIHPRARLRLVRPNERRPVAPTSGAWNIAIGSEMVPGYLASGLLSRHADTETWAAWSVEREEPVRIKVPRCDHDWSDPDPDGDPVTYRSWEQLSREHKLLDRLDHPGVVATYGADLEAEMPHAVFEYLDSTSLAQALERAEGGMDPLDVLYTGFELAGILDHLHRHGLVHLNLRAGHVRTRGDEIVVTDFSQCRPIGSVLPAPTGRVGNHRPGHRFFAPELQPGQTAAPAMDVYALGTLLRRATAGSAVDRASAGGDAPAPTTDLAPATLAVMAETIDRMLALDPTERPDATEVRSQLRKLLPRRMARPRVSVMASPTTRLRLVAAAN